MCRLFTGFTALLIICVGAGADYAAPEQWQWHCGFTHQSWDFGDDGEYGTQNIADTSVLPLGNAPDGEPNQINDYGELRLEEFSNSHPFMKGWNYVPDQIDTHRTAMYGGMGDTALSFTVPGMEADRHWIRQIRVQTIVYARKDGQKPAGVEIANDSMFSDTDGITGAIESLESLDEPQGYSAAWYRLTSLYEAAKSSGKDYVRVWAYFDPELSDPDRMGASMIDRVDIDTRLVLKADIDRNGTVNYGDFARIADNWNTDDAGADITDDGIVGSNDIAYLAAMWLANSY